MGTCSLPKPDWRKRLIRLGILSALPQEAQVITTNSKLCEPFAVANGISLVRSGIGERNASHGAAKLLETGANALLSFGVCGGIDPEIKTGGILIPTVVSNGEESIQTSTNWRTALEKKLEIDGLISSTLWYTSKPVLDPKDRKTLFDESGAQGIDMESLAVARVAEEAGLPFVAIRVVLDDAFTRLPRLATVAVDEWGELQLSRLLIGILRNPFEVPALMRLAGQLREAVRVLRKIYGRAGPGFLCDHA